jgi:hypothetical protein
MSNVEVRVSRLEEPESPVSAPETVNTGPITISIHAWGGDKFEMTVERNMTICDINDLVHERIGSCRSSQRMQFRGRQLDDEMTLEEAGVQDGALLRTIQRRWG